MKARWFTRVAITLIVLLPFLLHNRGDVRMGVLDRMEYLAYDFRLELTMPQTVDDRVVIVDIDEKSLINEGQWPWSRHKLARLVDSLFDHYGVRVVGFDAVFPEPDRASPMIVLEQLAEGALRNDALFLSETERLRPELQYDRIFAESLNDRKVVLGFVFRQPGEEGATITTGELPNPVISRQNHDTRIPFIEATGYSANLRELRRSALTGGFFNPAADKDGVQRRVPLLRMYRGDVYESLALALTRVARQSPPVQFEFYQGLTGPRDGLDLEWLNVGNFQVPVDEQAAALVPYRKQGSFPYVPATDVLAKTASNYPLKGSIVLIGTTAAGLHDLRTTPVGDKFPGVEVHANIISGILDQRVKHHPRYVQGIEFTLLIFIAIVMTLVLPRAPVMTATLLTALVIVIVAAGNLVLWNEANMVIPVASSITFAFALYLFHMIYGFFAETRGRRALSHLFGQYVPPELVAEMSLNPQNFDMESESRDLTVLFTDVRGFTGIAEGLDPPELSRLMNGFLTPMTRVIHRHRGTIDKYIGDAIMAFWGAPLNDPHHARNALFAAFEMQGALQAMNKDFKKKGWPEMQIGIGLNTGLMRVGNMGSEFRMAYTVMGDAVNLGSRLEGLTKTYGIDLMVGEGTKDKLPDYVFRKLDQVQVKGKAEPVNIYEPLGLTTEVSTEELDELRLYNEALRNYLNQEWRMAKMRFQNLQRMFTGRKLYDLYLDRTNYFDNNPPGDDWDGVFVFTTK